MKNFIIFLGLIYGMLSFVLDLAYSFNVLGVGINFIAQLATLFVLLFFASKAVKKHRTGTATFGQLINAFVPILVIGIVLSTLFNALFVRVISEERRSKLVDSAVTRQSEINRFMGMDESRIAAEEEDFQVKFRDQLSDPVKMLVSSLVGFLFMFVISLIPAAIFKKNPSIPTAEKTE